MAIAPIPIPSTGAIAIAPSSIHDPEARNALIRSAASNIVVVVVVVVVVAGGKVALKAIYKVEVTCTPKSDPLASIR